MAPHTVYMCHLGVSVSFAAATNYQKLSSLKQYKCSLLQFRRSRALSYVNKIKVSAELILSEASRRESILASFTF